MSEEQNFLSDKVEGQGFLVGPGTQAGSKAAQLHFCSEIAWSDVGSKVVWTWK